VKIHDGLIAAGGYQLEGLDRLWSKERTPIQRTQGVARRELAGGGLRSWGRFRSNVWRGVRRGPYGSNGETFDEFPGSIGMLFRTELAARLDAAGKTLPSALGAIHPAVVSISESRSGLSRLRGQGHSGDAAESEAPLTIFAWADGADTLQKPGGEAESADISRVKPSRTGSTMLAGQPTTAAITRSVATKGRSIFTVYRRQTIRSQISCSVSISSSRF